MIQMLCMRHAQQQAKPVSWLQHSVNSDNFRFTSAHLKLLYHFDASSRIHRIKKQNREEYRCR